ncbi:protease HtpX [Bacteroidia bacterium]|nr:protease HtpX [Bacteroidia bacterium]
MWAGNHEQETAKTVALTNTFFLYTIPYILGGVGLWFIIAYFAHIWIIKRAVQSRPLERKENKRVYNLVENLCMSQGTSTPQINVIDDSSLNAFASGINKKTYTVTLTTGIIQHLDDEELEAVIAHELTHIRNHDVRLMIISIVFVGIFAFLMQAGFRLLRTPGAFRSKNGKNGNSVIVIILIVAVVAAVGYLFSTLMRFAISKKREYMADAGSSEMTKRPWALASALRKISQDPLVEAIERKDIAQLFIEDPEDSSRKARSIFAPFASHPPIQKRIAILEQF